VPVEDALAEPAPADQRSAAPRPQLARAMRFRDLLLFYIVTGFSVRWIANAAVAGPSAVAIWIMACVGFYVPLVFTVLELSSRYPDEGGVYVWSKRAFGPFAGFTTAWTYWASNLPYFPGLLYFTAANALYLFGARGQALANSQTYFILASLAGLLFAVWLNVIGLNVSKWLHNLGALGLSIPAVILLGLAALVWTRFGSATAFTPASLVPSTHLKDIIFWSTVAFSLSGMESASMLGDEIENPRRNIPRALLIAGVIITSIYILSTVATLVALPPEHITIISGFIDAVAALTHRVGGAALVLIVAALMTVGGIGQCGAWFAASARLPFVAGLDQFLPPVFGRLHPRWGTPYVALLVQAAFSVALIIVSQLGTGVTGAYDVMVSVSVIAYFIPYLFMFAAMIRVQRLPAASDVARVPGGAPVAIILASVGFATTAISVVLALVPPPDEPAKWLAFLKVAGSTIVLVGIGVAFYAKARVRAARAGRAGSPDQPTPDRV
jgi:glutamate:GABA antiporter